MNLASIVVLCIVAGLLILSIAYSRKKGINRCNGNCVGCGVHCTVFSIAQVKKPQRSPTTPAFFDLHTRKNILRNWSGYLSNAILV